MVVSNGANRTGDVAREGALVMGRLVSFNHA